MSRPPNDYVEVHVRMKSFFEKYPNGSLVMDPPTIVEVGSSTYLMGQAKAFRTPEDQSPGVGTAWEPVPGQTNFTRGSEPQNLETSCWGRAMAALGIETKAGIASAHEVRSAQARERTAEKPAARSAELVAADMALVAAATTEDELRSLWGRGAHLHDAIVARRAEIVAEATE